MTTRKSSTTQSTSVMLSTTADDLGLVPAAEATARAASEASEQKTNVTIRDAVTDETLATIKPSTPRGHSRRVKHKVRLRELSIRNAKPEAKPYMIWDLVQRGLGLRVQPKPTGSKSWKCVYSRGGKPRWYHIGNADVIGLADARVKASEIMLAVDKDGRDPAGEKSAERSSGTFADLAAKHLAYAQKKNKSWRQADALIRRYALPRLGKLQATTISRSDIKTMLARIEAPILANQVLASTSAIFTWAIDEEILPVNHVNPCRKVKRNDPQSRERVLADSELPKFWPAFDDAGLIVSSALKTILLTGQRPGEVAHMRREHIVDGWWEMPGKPVPALGWLGTKNKQTHRVWLSAPVQALIAELGDDGVTTGFVFSSRGRRPIRGPAEAMRKICGKLGVERATPHDLRRTFLTKVTGLKFGRDAMDRIANHKEKGKVTDTYDRFSYSEDDRRIMETVAARLLALVEGRTDDKVVQFITR